MSLTIEGLPITQNPEVLGLEEFFKDQVATPMRTENRP